MRDHRKLEAFRLADSLVLQIYEATRTFPSEERFGLAIQLRRAAISVGANIVEGAARPSHTEYVRYLAIAFGSARELEYEISVAKRLHYLNEKAASDLEVYARRTCAALYGLIRRLSDLTRAPRPTPRTR
jgi:four helix bundle protein